MSFTNLDVPAQGDATKQPFAEGMVNNEAFLYSEVANIKSSQIPNGSFELDSNNDGTPDRWVVTLYTGGTSDLVTTEQIHGLRSWKVISPGGSGNGGGYITSEDFFEVSPNVPVGVSWEQKSTAAGVLNVVEVLWYDKDQAAVSTTTLYSSTNNPTSWTVQLAVAVPPSTARFAKLRLTGAKNTNTTAGTVYWDDVRLLSLPFTRKTEYITNGTFVWRCPTDILAARVTCIGGGGTGGVTGATKGGGGGGGGVGRSIVTVTPGTSYTIVVGAAGSNSTFATTTVIGNAGANGVNDTAGAGGSGTGNEVFAGQNGTNGTVNDWGLGGSCPLGGGGGGTLTGASGGHIPGGGGSGGSGAGAIGKVIIEY